MLALLAETAGGGAGGAGGTGEFWPAYGGKEVELSSMEIPLNDFEMALPLLRTTAPSPVNPAIVKVLEEMKLFAASYEVYHRSTSPSHLPLTTLSIHTHSAHRYPNSAIRNSSLPVPLDTFPLQEHALFQLHSAKFHYFQADNVTCQKLLEIALQSPNDIKNAQQKYSHVLYLQALCMQGRLGVVLDGERLMVPRKKHSRRNPWWNKANILKRSFKRCNQTRRSSPCYCNTTKPRRSFRGWRKHCIEPVSTSYSRGLLSDLPAGFTCP